MERRGFSVGKPNWNIGVIGLGSMGSGIAQVAASHGFPVTAVETTTARCEEGIERIRRFMNRGVELGKTAPDEVEKVIRSIRTSTALADLRDSDLVIEAVFEDLNVKRAVFKELVLHVRASTILATNTSALAIHKVAQGIGLQTPLIGLHFFNPPPLMRLVEVVKPFNAPDQLIDQAKEFCQAIGKTPIVVKNRPGFLVNRLLMPYLNQAMDAFDHGLATREDLDVAVELGLGYPMGPLKLMDQIGLDVHLHATTALFEQTHAPEFRPPAILQELVDAGRVGKKTGEGFYLYVANEAPRHE